MLFQQEIVQRLFDDQEEESSPNEREKDPEEPVQDTVVWGQMTLKTCPYNQS